MYALSPKRSRNAVEKVESKLLNRVSGFGSNSKLFSKEKREKKKAILPGLGVLKARFWSKILPEWVEIL